MNPVEDFFKNPSRDIGGAVIPLIGKPGSGKTNALLQLALMRKREGHKIIWRGIKEAEWFNFLANGEDVCVWNHESFDRVRVKTSDSSGTTYFELDEIDGIEVKQWSDPSEIVENSSKDVINVVNAPGNRNTDQDHNVWFTKKITGILDAIVNRENTYEWVDFFTDEVGDIWPSQKEAKGELHRYSSRVAPKLMAQCRKQNSFVYMASHGVQDFHHMIYKIKSNTIGYMRYSNVVKSLHPSVDRSKVNKLDRGELIIPPYYRESFTLAYEADSLEWVKEDGVVELDWSYDLNLDEKDEEEFELDDLLRYLREETEWSTRTIASKVNEFFDKDISHMKVQRA